jgi:hypothetical protein
VSSWTKDRIVVSEIYPFVTATNFGKNRMGNPASGGPSSNYADGDKLEFVAGLVLQAIEEGQAQKTGTFSISCSAAVLRFPRVVMQDVSRNRD